ncbi:skin secretory protein xP2-like [Panicum miliaceum]|uniref:Skin secretory protein xP2-like n=1 Tax=Panicum miliaceum TaxID=4540 RepID=A0A3L6T5H8_PANMI|nr:skin secretory protein xP2-like [Panicum miliaceum]
MDRRPPLAVSPRRLRPRPQRVPRPPLVPASSVKTPPGSMKKAAAPMRASICAIPSPIRLEPSPMRASISALPSPARFEPSPARASTAAALPPPTRAAKVDFPATASPPAKAPAGKENLLPAAAPSTSPAVAGAAEKENLLPAGADAHDELVALNLAAVARAAGTPAAGPLFVRGRLYDLYSARRDERLKRKLGFPYNEDSASAALDPEAMAEDPCVAVELSKRRVAKKAYATTGAESVRRSMPAADFAAGRAGGGLALRSSLRSSKEMKKASAASGTVSLAVKERRVNPRSSARRI